ncbi:hypothetical protein BJV78DRAFT_1113244, partial [Lactifluus subvellereus]
LVDTTHRHTLDSVWRTNRFGNQLAARPSLHFGYALIVGVSLFTTHASYRSRCTTATFFLLYQAAMPLAIIVTASHYLLGACAG